MNTEIIAVDPGSSKGSVAVMINGDLKYLIRLSEISKKELNQKFKEWKERWPDIKGIIEAAQTYPGDGKVSSGKYLEAFGALKMLFIVNDIDFDKVHPQRWQNRVPGCKKVKGATKNEHKNAMKAVCQQMFQTKKIVLENADAPLIA